MRRKRSDVAHSVVKACGLLRAFRFEGELLQLRDFVARSSMSKSTTHRLLKSLEEGGLVERVGADRFRSLVKTSRGSAARVGFATRGSASPFSRAVTESVQRAAAEASIDLVTVDNRRSPTLALRNVEHLIREGVELVIEYQSHERTAPLISSRLLKAEIPVIAIEIPHPGAVFFGANNYEAGLLAGRALGQWVKHHWDGSVDEILLLGESIAGPLPRLRLHGAMVGLREVLPRATEIKPVEIDGRGVLEQAYDLVRRRLRRSPARRTAAATVNDPMALGVLRAFEESGRSDLCWVVGQNLSPETREELRRPHTRLIGSVAYFPERYGDRVIALARKILAGETVPPAVYTHHQLVTAANVDRVYPTDDPASAARGGVSGAAPRSSSALSKR